MASRGPAVLGGIPWCGAWSGMVNQGPSEARHNMFWRAPACLRGVRRDSVSFDVLRFKFGEQLCVMASKGPVRLGGLRKGEIQVWRGGDGASWRDFARCVKVQAGRGLDWLRGLLRVTACSSVASRALVRNKRAMPAKGPARLAIIGSGQARFGMWFDEPPLCRRGLLWGTAPFGMFC